MAAFALGFEDGKKVCFWSPRAEEEACEAPACEFLSAKPFSNRVIVFFWYGPKILTF